MPRDFEQATPEDVSHFQSQACQSSKTFDDMRSRRKWMSRPVSDHAAEAAGGQPTFFSCGVEFAWVWSVGGAVGGRLVGKGKRDSRGSSRDWRFMAIHRLPPHSPPVPRQKKKNAGIRHS
jgi:hypothetical protein